MSLRRIRAGWVVTWGIEVFTACMAVWTRSAMPLPLLLRTANLTDAQKQQIHTIFENRRASRKAEYQQLKAAKEAIAAKFTSTGTVAASDLSVPVTTITQIHDQMMNEQIQDAIAIRNVLTPAQLTQISATKAKLDSIHAEMKALWAQSGSPQRLNFHPDRIATSPVPPSDQAGSRPSRLRPRLFS